VGVFFVKDKEKIFVKDKKSKEVVGEFTPNMIMKYEIAEELGLIDKLKRLGWGGLTAKETGPYLYWAGPLPLRPPPV
jgi:small acid-soluble spore protein F (minor alpha/beta-type SASP)